MAASIKDISRITGINICSVSRVLSGHPRGERVRPELREQIFAAAKSLGYRRNEIAAAMARKHNKALALVTGDMGTVDYTGRIQNGVLGVAAAKGYNTTVYRLEEMSSEEILHRILGWRVAGVIFHVASLKYIAGLTAELDREEVPWGTVNLSHADGIGVTSDDRQGVLELVRILKETGHRRPVYVYIGPDDGGGEFHTNRLQGFRDGMAACYPGDEVLELPLTLNRELESGPDTDAAVRRLQALQADAAVCEFDRLAIILAQSAGRLGLAVPEELSFTGFGASEIAEISRPPLTTVEQYFEIMGARTAELVIYAAENKNPAMRGNLTLPVLILKRQSVFNHISPQPKNKEQL